MAVSVANYGHEAYFVTKLPKHEIGQIAVNALRRYGVNTQFIARGGERVGLYYAETGASMRPSKVIYDRATVPLRRLSLLTLILTPSWKVRNGFTGVASRQLSATMPRSLPSWLAKQRNAMA